jgi:hypothetical protein
MGGVLNLRLIQEEIENSLAMETRKAILRKKDR